jgi:hypothetical protein
VCEKKRHVNIRFLASGQRLVIRNRGPEKKLMKRGRGGRNTEQQGKAKAKANWLGSLQQKRNGRTDEDRRDGNDVYMFM